MRVLTGLIAALTLLAGCGRAPKTCQVCQRDECHGLRFRVTLTTGQRIETCCPRCALHYLATAPQPARSLEATDLSTSRWMDATQAVYLTGSNVSPCAKREAYRDAYGCCALKGFDRCSPSLIAFASAESARAFQQHHGGDLLSWKQLNPQPPTR